MEKETEFYKLLKAAVTDNNALETVLNTIMPLINKYSKNNYKVIDNDLKSTLLTYSIELIRIKKIYKKF